MLAYGPRTDQGCTGRSRAGSRRLHGMDGTLRYSRVALEMFTHGVFTDERALTAWDAIRKQREAR